MKLTKKIKQLVLQCDLFKTTEYLRYKGEPQYRTFTGGFCSIMIFIVFAVLFYNAVLSTISKSKMGWGYNLIQNTTDQLNMTITTKNYSKFMFAVGINNLNMNEGERYFDLKFSQFLSSGGVDKQIQIPLSPCDRSVWDGANSEILQIYDRYNFSQLLCPPQNINFSIAGSKSSLDFKYIKISASKCNDSLSSRPCANSTTLSNFLLSNQNFQLNYYFVNGLLNPSSDQEITFYLQDRNYVPFNLVYGGSSNIYISRYSFSTDESIWPFEQIRYSQGGIVNFVGQYLASSVFQGQYASIYLRKSHVSFDISRFYAKMDSTLSYIGGLFGFFMIAFIFMQLYTEYSYEVQMGDQLFYYNQNIPFDSNKFHFVTFLLYLIYSFFKIFGCSPNIELMKKFDQCRNQVHKQFDIAFLMKRILFFERSLRILFQDHQFKGLHMHDKMTVKEAQELRSYYRLRDRLKVKLDNKSDNQCTFEKQSEEYSRSHELNLTENIISNAPQQKRFSNFDNDDKMKKYSYTRKVHPENELSKRSKAEMNNSQVTIHQKGIQLKQMDSNKNQFLSQNNNLDISSKIKILRKESESGNLLSKKILEGLDTGLLKNILLKIEQNVQNEENQILVRENENDFEIRISKRGNLKDEQQRMGEKFQKIISNIKDQRLDQQASKIEISSAYQEQEFNIRSSVTSQNEKKKKHQNNYENDFQFT